MMRKLFYLMMGLLLACAMYGQSQQNIQCFKNMPMQNKTFVLEIPVSTAWSFQLVWANCNQTNAICKIEVSDDNTNFILYAANMTDTLSSAAGTMSFADDNFAFRYIRISFTKGTNTTGTINGYLCLKNN